MAEVISRPLGSTTEDMNSVIGVTATARPASSRGERDHRCAVAKARASIAAFTSTLIVRIAYMDLVVKKTRLGHPTKR